jgi:hypothetical protein
MKRVKRRCLALTRAGKPCGAAPTPSGLCFFHANPIKASELGRIGGKQNRSSRVALPSATVGLDGASSASDRLEALYGLVLSGAIPLQKAAVLIKITYLQLKIEESTGIEKLKKNLEILKQVIEMRDIDASAPEDESSEAESSEDDGCMPRAV